MTSPYDDELTSSFEVDINFRQDSVRSLDEVTDLLSRARTESEALSRASSDVVESLREAASTEPIDLMGSSQGGGSAPSAPSGGGRIAPLEAVSGGDRSPSNREVGVGSDAGSESLEERVAPAQSGPSQQTVDDRLEDLNRKDPDRIENLRAARGMELDPEGSENLLAKGVGGFSNLSQSILSETRPGGSFSGTMAKAAEGIGAVGSNSGIAGLLGGKGAGALGMLGGALTVGVAANAAIQAGGQQMQQYRNMGSVQGGGGTEGLSHEIGIRSMAMSPFLTTEQSRQIVMTSLSEGYTGKEFDTVTDYMAENMKKMNMDVAQSTQILRKNVEEGGQSIDQLAADLSSLKSSTQGGVMSLEERTQLYQQASGQMIDMGIDADNASLTALTSLELFEDDRQLSGVFTDIISNPSDALIMQAGKAAGYRGRNPYQMKQIMGDDGTFLSSQYELIRRWANDIEARNNDDLTKRQLFNQQLGKLGVQMTPNDSDALYEELIAEGSENLVTEAEDRYMDEEYGVQDDESGGIVQTGREIGAVLGLGAQAIGDTIGMLNFGAFVEDETFASNFSEAYSSTGQKYQHLSNTFARGASDGEINMMHTLNERFGANNVQLIDDDGNEYLQANGLSREEMERITSGDIKVQINGRDPVDIKDARALMEEGHFDEQDEDGRLGSSNVSVEVSPTPELRRMLRFDTKTTNQQQADHGWGTSTHNNPPPGDF